jgi:hypothetical protein
MYVTLTWDLLVIVFFAIVVAYSFIVGKDESVKIVIAAYIASVAVQGIGNLLMKLSDTSQPLVGFFGYALDMDLISTAKIVLFVTLIIFLAIKGGFEMSYEKEMEGIWQTALTGLFGFSTAGLLLSTLVTYIAARPILDTQIATSPSLGPLLLQSRLVQMMVDYQDVWFALPAFLLLAVGVLGNRK